MATQEEVLQHLQAINPQASPEELQQHVQNIASGADPVMAQRVAMNMFSDAKRKELLDQAAGERDSTGGRISDALAALSTWGTGHSSVEAGRANREARYAHAKEGLSEFDKARERALNEGKATTEALKSKRAMSAEDLAAGRANTTFGQSQEDRLRNIEQQKTEEGRKTEEFGQKKTLFEQQQTELQKKLEDERKQRDPNSDESKGAFLAAKQIPGMPLAAIAGKSAHEIDAFISRYAPAQKAQFDQDRIKAAEKLQLTVAGQAQSDRLEAKADRLENKDVAKRSRMENVQNKIGQKFIPIIDQMKEVNEGLQKAHGLNQDNLVGNLWSRVDPTDPRRASLESSWNKVFKGEPMPKTISATVKRLTEAAGDVKRDYETAVSSRFGEEQDPAAQEFAKKITPALPPVWNPGRRSGEQTTGEQTANKPSWAK